MIVWRIGFDNYSLFKRQIPKKKKKKEDFGLYRNEEQHEIGTVNGILWINGYEGVTYICVTRVFQGGFLD